MDKAIETVSNGCHQCAALQKIPHTLNVQSTGDPPETIGSAFAADVMKRERQLILVVREYVTSYTAARVITDERHETLHNSWCNITTFVGSQLHNTSYRVRRSDCYKVPSLLNTISQQRTYNHDNCASSDEDDNTVKTPSPPKPPDIPNVISVPNLQQLEPVFVKNEQNDLSLPIDENELQHEPDDQVNTDVSYLHGNAVLLNSFKTIMFFNYVSGNNIL
ncbi:unnamed protein product [Mytilus coruscus]|uniref:Uncharacterized protein n=1 Tax=Mytilus coruscus TaxID=42192 RepID=A0A6J8C725_MYTCO|nr:unnamed protein product [Mytilus coruscus]